MSSHLAARCDVTPQKCVCPFKAMLCFVLFNFLHSTDLAVVGVQAVEIAVYEEEEDVKENSLADGILKHFYK